MNREKVKIVLVNFLILTLVFGFLEISSGYLLAYRRQRGSQLMHLIYKLKTKFSVLKSSSNKLKVIKEMNETGKKTFPAYLFDPQRHSPNSFYWLTYPINRNIVLCDEGEGLVNFQTNNLGFRQLADVKNPKKIEYIFLGDSYIEGSCVEDKFTIPQSFANFANKDYENVLNAGIGGSGPLFQLAIFKELLELDKNKTISLAENGQVILTIFAGNDLRNLAEEKTTKLVKYMQKDFTQDYFKNIKNISNKQELFLDSLLKNDDVFQKDSTLVEGHGYGETINNPYAVNAEIILFEEILLRFKELADDNNLSLNFVLISDHPYFENYIQEPTQKSLKSFCKTYKIKCLEINVRNVKGNLPGHFDSKGYIDVSKRIVNYFINK